MIISFLGILAGVIVFVILAFRGTTLLVSALSASLIMIVTSGLPILGTITDIWLVGFGGFLKGYFLLFVLSSLFGRVMTDGGASKRIALGLSHIIELGKSTRTQKYLAALIVPLLYCVMTFVGISGFVAVFTVLAVGREVLQKYDVPWRLYCYGGTTSLATMIIAGSLQASNIISMNISGSGTTAAGMGLSLVAGGAFLLTIAVLVWLDIRKAEKTGEGFMDTGAEFASVEMDLGLSNEELPPLVLSVVPPLIVVLGCAIFQLNVIMALALGILACYILFFKQIKRKGINATLTSGLTSAFTPVINVAATAAIAGIIQAVPGFGVVEQALAALPPLYSGIGLTALVAFALAGPEATLNSFGPQIFANFTAAGLTPAIAHRMMCISAFTCIPPHSAAVINATGLARISYKKGLFIYLRGSLLAGLAALLAAVLCINLGILV